VKAGDWTLEGERVVAGGHWLEPGEFTLTMVADGDRPSTTVGDGRGVIVLDVDVTPELELEGRARDLIRLVQLARRDADLAVSDRIELTISADQDWIDAARAHEALITAETLTSALVTDDTGTDTPEITVRRAG
jgi:isoleucyl-tRNA synthetase